MSLPKGGMPRVAAECALVRPIKFGDIVAASSSDHCSDKIELLPHGDCPFWVISGHLQCKKACPLYPRKRRPSALAVLRLMTSSTFVTCCTGRPAGLSPLRMRPVHPKVRKFILVFPAPDQAIEGAPLSPANCHRAAPTWKGPPGQ